MNSSRRDFIKNSGLVLAGSAIVPQIFHDFGKPGDAMVGIQLYTLRDDMQKDPAKTLKSLAGMGYKHVEHAGYENRKFYNYSISDFRKLLSDNGLVMASGHSFLGSKQWDKSKNDFTDDWKYTIEDAASVGMKYVISPGVDEELCKDMDTFKWYMELFNKTGELCKKSGVTFTYHNESYEFNHNISGTPIYEHLLKMAETSLVAQQIDIGNMYEPGGRAMNYLKKYPGRFMLMHVKDEIKKAAAGQNGQLYESALLGKGVVGVKGIVDFARTSGTKYFIIEQEDYQDKTPLECAAEDLKTMKGWGF
jgi:sugar phosphate isomerase/epimerase